MAGFDRWKSDAALRRRLQARPARHSSRRFEPRESLPTSANVQLEWNSPIGPAIATIANMQSRDTTSDASDTQREAHRRLGPARRVELAFAMSHRAREISIAGMCRRNPDLSYAAARALLLARLAGTEEAFSPEVITPK